MVPVINSSVWGTIQGEFTIKVIMNVQKLLKDKSIVNLDISIGLEEQKGYVTLNDVGTTFDKFPYPLPDNSVDFIKCVNVLEKISREDKKVIKFMNELWRILKPDGQLAIATIYGQSYAFYADPTNINPMNETFFAFFDPLEKISGGAYYKIHKPKPWKLAQIAFAVNGTMEVELIKRREDKSYVK